MRYITICFFVFFYFIIHFTLILVSIPFLISWGGKRSFYNYIVMFILEFPVNWIGLTKNIILDMVLNTAFWTLVLLVVLYFIKRLKILSS